MESSAAVVAGGTGLIGSLLLRELEKHPAYSRVVALVRRAPPPSGRCEFVVGGVDALNRITIAPGGQLFCAVGSTLAKAGSEAAFRAVDYELPLKFAEWGRACGASCFVLVSAIGADATSSNFYAKTKGELERDLAAMAFPALHLFQPSFLLGARAEFRPKEALGIPIARALSFAMVGGLRKYRPVQAENVAKAMLAAAGSNERGIHRYTFDEIERLARDPISTGSV